MNYRSDIQALRGIAVLMVIIYHARLLPIDKGFLGVDIFFVISGFLITGQLAKQIANQQFSFRRFYLRRLWRLLPAAYTVFIFCIILAPWTLSFIEQQNFVYQIWGALSFTANFVLWNQAAYFDGPATLKPLLHTWSLAVEEQYYMLMPLLLFFIAQSKWLRALTIISLLSFIGYVLANNKPDVAFYLTPLRIWELGIGSILAIVLTKRQPRIPAQISVVMTLICLAVISVSLDHSLDDMIAMIIVVISTALIIAAQPPWLANSWLAKQIAKVGTISYSLYLVHWPIIAFLNNMDISGGGVWWPYRIAAVLISFVLATLLYFVVEARFRIIDEKQNKGFRTLIVSSLIVLALTFNLSFSSDGASYETQFRPNYGLSKLCSSTEFDRIDECKTTAKPTSLLWGDSYAMHLAAGLEVMANEGIRQATMGACAPISGITFTRSPDFGLDWAEDCLKFNQRVESYVLNEPSIKWVILASPWSHLIKQPKKLIQQEDATVVATLEIDQIASHLSHMIKRLQERGKKVVVVAPPPSSGFRIAKCHERNERGQWQIDIAHRPDCKLDYTDHLKRSKEVGLLMSALVAKGIAIYSFEDKLCDQNYCQTKLDNVILYRDRGHLSYAGSRHYAMKFDLFNELKSLAR